MTPRLFWKASTCTVFKHFLEQFECNPICIFPFVPGETTTILLEIKPKQGKLKCGSMWGSQQITVTGLWISAHASSHRLWCFFWCLGEALPKYLLRFLHAGWRRAQPWRWEAREVLANVLLGSKETAFSIKNICRPVLPFHPYPVTVDVPKEPRDTGGKSRDGVFPC